MGVDIDIVAVLVATVVSMVIGMVWYNEKVFGAAWIKMAKINTKKDDWAWTMGSAIISSFVMAYVLAHFIGFAHHVTEHDALGRSFMQDALLTSAWAFAGFQGLRFFMHDQFNQRRKKESIIHIGYDFVTIMAMGLVIGLFGA